MLDATINNIVTKKSSLFSELACSNSPNQATCNLGNIRDQMKQEAMEEKPSKGMLCKFFTSMILINMWL